MTIESWLQLMQTLGFARNEETYESLRAAYAETHRHYHNGAHIQACLAHLECFSALASHPAEIALALWFHDAIYKPLSNANERNSAAWAASFLTANEAAPELATRVQRLIMVTAHNAPTASRDESILVDVDLAILGAQPPAYAEYEEAIRREYRIIPTFIFRKKRIEVLDSFLRRPRIYHNAPFRSERERQARSNLANAISRLSARG